MGVLNGSMGRTRRTFFTWTHTCAKMYSQQYIACKYRIHTHTLQASFTSKWCDQCLLWFICVTKTCYTSEFLCKTSEKKNSLSLKPGVHTLPITPTYTYTHTHTTRIACMQIWNNNTQKKCICMYYHGHSHSHTHTEGFINHAKQFEWNVLLKFMLYKARQRLELQPLIKHKIISAFHMCRNVD